MIMICLVSLSILCHDLDDDEHNQRSGACNPIRPNASPAPLIRLSSEDNSGILSSSSAHLFEGGRDVRESESDSVLKYQAFFLHSFQRNLDAVLYSLQPIWFP